VDEVVADDVRRLFFRFSFLLLLNIYAVPGVDLVLLSVRVSFSVMMFVGCRPLCWKPLTTNHR
jgi:hypothetical protein